MTSNSSFPNGNERVKVSEREKRNERSCTKCNHLIRICLEVLSGPELIANGSHFNV